MFCREVRDLFQILLFPAFFYNFFRLKKAEAIVSVYFEKKEGDSNGKVFGQKFTGKEAGG